MRFERYGTGIAKGMALTFKHLFRKWITVQYPEQKLVMSRRIRGTNIIWDKETCTGCKACDRACPVGCIEIEVSRGEDRKLKVDYIGIDMGLCIFCGLCVEACPTGNSLYMAYNYERTTYRCTDISCAYEGVELTPSDKRCGELLFANDDLLLSEGKQMSGYARPEVAKILPEQTLLVNQTQYLEDLKKRWA